MALTRNPSALAEPIRRSGTLTVTFEVVHDHDAGELCEHVAQHVVSLLDAEDAVDVWGWWSSYDQVP